MPRIEADSIEEHVRIQTGRILDAASDLFTERGYGGTDLRDIAAAIGLRRNSLYRYFPNKDHILLACLQREMEPNLKRLKALEQRFPDPRQRIEAWLELQMQIAATACHGMMNMAAEISESSAELRSDIRAMHQPLNQVLRGAVNELLAQSGRDSALVSEMIASMVRSAAAADCRSERVLEELKTSVQRVLDV